MKGTWGASRTKSSAHVRPPQERAAKCQEMAEQFEDLPPVCLCPGPQNPQATAASRTSGSQLSRCAKLGPSFGGKTFLFWVGFQGFVGGSPFSWLVLGCYRDETKHFPNFLFAANLCLSLPELLDIVPVKRQAQSWDFLFVVFPISNERWS